MSVATESLGKLQKNKLFFSSPANEVLQTPPPPIPIPIPPPPRLSWVRADLPFPIPIPLLVAGH